jgi:hypothetical protein
LSFSSSLADSRSFLKASDEPKRTSVALGVGVNVGVAVGIGDVPERLRYVLLREEGQRERVRRVARPLIARPVPRLSSIAAAWRAELES